MSVRCCQGCGEELTSAGSAPCRRCGGSGYDPDPEPRIARSCPACHGDGTQVRADLELLADLIAMPGDRA